MMGFLLPIAILSMLHWFSIPSGVHSVDVTYDGSPVPSSPFRVPVTEGCDPRRVRVHGPGIQSGTTNKPNKFTVETR